MFKKIVILNSMAIAAISFSSSMARASGEGPKMTLKEKKNIKKVEEQLKYYTDKFSEKCGKNIKWSVDYSSFAKDKQLGVLASTIASACQGAIFGATELCEADKDYVEAMQGAFNSFTCRHVNKSDKTGLMLDKKTKALVVNVNIKKSGEYKAIDQANSKGWFEKNL